MAPSQASLDLLETPLAGELLQSALVARLAYVGRNGTPCVVPIWFHWTGDMFVLGTPASSPKVRAVTARPSVALTIDDPAWPYRGLQIRGVAAIEIVNGVVSEYAEAARRYLGAARGRAWIEQVQPLFSPMARITIRPKWVSVLDLAQLLPQVVDTVRSSR